MKILLIVLFVILFVYLVIHMCRESGNGRVSVRSDLKTDKIMLILDGLMVLNDKELYRLKNDIQNIKVALDRRDKNPVKPIRSISRLKPAAIDKRDVLSGKKVLKKIKRQLRDFETRNYRNRGNPFSKIRIIFIQIALMLITLFMILY
jgi:hypothetical protein